MCSSRIIDVQERAQLLEALDGSSYQVRLFPPHAHVSNAILPHRKWWNAPKESIGLKS